MQPEMPRRCLLQEVIGKIALQALKIAIDEAREVKDPSSQQHEELREEAFSFHCTRDIVAKPTTALVELGTPSATTLVGGGQSCPSTAVEPRTLSGSRMGEPTHRPRSKTPGDDTEDDAESRDDAEGGLTQFIKMSEASPCNQSSMMPKQCHSAP